MKIIYITTYNTYKNYIKPRSINYIYLVTLTMQSVVSKYIKQRLTLWHEIFPLSSNPSNILCRSKCLFTWPIHFSRLWFNFILMNMQKNIAAALRTNHMTPSPNKVRPVTPENNKPSNTINAVNIQSTRILL